MTTTRMPKHIRSYIQQLINSQKSIRARAGLKSLPPTINNEELERRKGELLDLERSMPVDLKKEFDEFQARLMRLREAEKRSKLVRLTTMQQIAAYFLHRHDSEPVDAAWLQQRFAAVGLPIELEAGLRILRALAEKGLLQSDSNADQTTESFVLAVAKEDIIRQLSYARQNYEEELKKWSRHYRTE